MHTTHGRNRGSGMVSLISLTLVAGVLAVACATTPSSAPAASGPPAEVGGSWVGGLTGAGISTPVTLRLSQQGTALSGDINVAGRPDFTGPVQGRVDGNDVRLALQSGFGSLGAMQVHGDEISGYVAGARMILRRARSQ